MAVAGLLFLLIVPTIHWSDDILIQKPNGPSVTFVQNVSTKEGFYLFKLAIEMGEERTPRVEVVI